MKRTLTTLWGVVLPFACLGSSLRAAETAASPWHFHGFVDAYGSISLDEEASGQNFAGLAAVGLEEGELALNMALLEISHDGPWGFNLAVGGGDELDALRLAEKDWVRDDLRYFYQASAFWQGEKLKVEAGLYPSHIGFESALPRDNWNYTHSWVAVLSPFYQVGVKGIWQASEATSFEVHLVNGWQRIADDNDGKSVGLKVAHRFAQGSITLNTLNGDEETADGSQPRSLYDLILTWDPAPGWSLALETYRGEQERKSVGDAEWVAGALAVRRQLGPHSLAARIERFDDGDGGISGTAQRLESVTATWDWQVHERVKTRFELRRDRSSAAFFATEDGPSRDQSLGLVALLFSF